MKIKTKTPLAVKLWNLFSEWRTERRKRMARDAKFRELQVAIDTRDHFEARVQELNRELLS